MIKELMAGRMLDCLVGIRQTFQNQKWQKLWLMPSGDAKSGWPRMMAELLLLEADFKVTSFLRIAIGIPL